MVTLKELLDAYAQDKPEFSTLLGNSPIDVYIKFLDLVGNDVGDMDEHAQRVRASLEGLEQRIKDFQRAIRE